MAEIGAAEAARALVDHFGAQLESGRDEGRRLMANALHQQFGVTLANARQLVDALEHAGTIRWIVRHTDSGRAIGTFGSTPIVGALHSEGYWQLEPA